jgi:3-hydroxyisobutyrate dehydrogenase-like beta-hydroxyacid dehydrogenase
MRAGFIGLGSQGGPMARRIVEHGHPLVVWARRPETLEPFADTTAIAVESPAEVGAASDVVGICVMTDADVEDVVLRPDGVLAGMAAGGVLAIHSTVHPDTCRKVAARAAERGVDVIDAPVNGGGPAAADGHLVVMVGGDAAVLERARPVLSTFGEPILRLGPIGSGQAAKLLNNFLFTAQLAVGLEIFDFADRLGVDRGALAQVLSKGSGGSFGIQIVAGTGFTTGGFRQVVDTVLTKDVNLMFDVAARLSAPEPPHVAALARTALRRYAQGE